ncbi:hypothetical protein BDZ45DRAFT_678518 [Acephala macrosclerotiorum]|nr:hypothetical protein BDZ45DRAFT_678518 [Acephala macrosclerotiorum]
MAAPRSPRISFDEEGQRPYVVAYAQKPKFRVGQKVYVHNGGTREGPYIIATITLTKCTCCLENGEPVKNGEEIDVDYVEVA